MNNICELKNVFKSYQDGEKRKLTILNGVNFQVKKENLHLITGSSGSGKSTLLYLLGVLDTADSGDVYFNNQSIKNFKEKKLCMLRRDFIGFVFQFHYLLPDFSAFENIYLSGLIKDKDSKALKHKTTKLLDLVELSHRKHHRPAQLSGGEQQRVAIARALIHSPRLILADEPTGNLDLETGIKVFQILKQVCLENKSSLVLVTHNSELIGQFDTRYQLSKGELKLISTK